MKTVIITLVVLAFSTSAFAWGAKKSSGAYKKSSGGSYKAKTYAPKKSYKSYKK